MIFLFLYLRHCAFAANPKEITVNNFASTFDNADNIHSSDATIVNRIEFAFS